MNRSTNKTVRKLIRIFKEELGSDHDKIAYAVKAARAELGVVRPQREKQDQVYYTTEQIQKIMKGIPVLYRSRHVQLVTYLQIYLMLYTSPRIGSIMDIKVNEVSLDRGVIKISSSKGGKPYHVHLPDTVIDNLRIYLGSIHPKQVYLFEKQKAGLPNGKYTTRALQKKIIQLREWATTTYGEDFSRFTAHSCRRTYLTEGAAAGVPLAALGKQANHKDVNTTHEHYILNNPIIAREAANRVNQYQHRKVRA